MVKIIYTFTEKILFHFSNRPCKVWLHFLSNTVKFNRSKDKTHMYSLTENLKDLIGLGIRMLCKKELSAIDPKI